MEEPVSSKKVLRKLKALEILTDRSVHALDMAELLAIDGVISHKQHDDIKRASSGRAELILSALELASKEGRVDLLDYEWQILPTQRILLTIVTSSGIREFKHEEP